jgi:4-aminobutyrate aminotransferase/(S)-3-amino-2-methylpropionate transaminase
MAIQLKTSIPGPNSQALMKRRQQAVPRGPFHITPVFIRSAKGAVLEDVDGNQLLDFAAGIGVLNVGHRDEGVLRALHEQAERYLHLSFNVTPYEPYLQVCERLNAAAPGNYAKKTFLANSGAEAVENAIKIARAFTGRQAVICFDHAFHGRTYLAMTMTSKAKLKQGFGPLNPEIYRAPFPYLYRWQGTGPQGGDAETVSKQAFEAFENIVLNQVGATNTAAVVIEPVLGEGGFIPAPREFLARLRQFCTANGIVLIADEIQTGFGRTGTLFACEQLGLVPDLITSAKGLGGGTPISAVTGRADIMDGPPEGGIGGTFGGSPIACAAALAVFDLVEKGGVLSQARELGEALERRLAAWKERFPAIGDIRGLGPMRAFELVKDRSTKEPDAETPKALVKYCYERGVVLMTAGTYGNVVRLLMPLTISREELDEGLAVVENGLRELLK